MRSLILSDAFQDKYTRHATHQSLHVVLHEDDRMLKV